MQSIRPRIQNSIRSKSIAFVVYSSFTRRSSGDRLSRQLALRISYHRSVCQLREHGANTDDYRPEIAQTPRNPFLVVRAYHDSL